MPTFLTHEKSPVYPSNTDFLDLDPNNTLSLARKRDTAGTVDTSNGYPHSISLHNHRHPQPTHDSFDESSFSSAHTSEISYPNPAQVNGTRPTSMSSLSNDRTANGGLPHDAAYHDSSAHPNHHRDEQHNPLQNGSIVKMPQRPPPPPPAATVAQGFDGSLSARDSDADVTDPASLRSTTATSVVPDSPANSRHSNPEQHDDGAEPRPTHSPRQSETTLSQAVPATTTTTTTIDPLSRTPSLPPDHRSPSTTPHRLSSPPLYHSASGAAINNTPSSLHAPSTPSLKQRHTLEVPRPQPGRTSKDGIDSAVATGRFSPTPANPVVRRASVSLARRNTRSMQSDAPRDEVMPDEDALRWAEAYRQKRASKRKKKEEEDDDRVLVGTKVDEHHANWVTAYNMLTGIRVSVSRTNAKLDRPLTDADFEAKQKSTFDIAGNELVPSAKYDFKFKDYAPWVFRHLRALFHLDPADYLMSLTGKYILSELGSPGKSGSFFYFSRDYKYIIKTIHHAEHKFLRKVLKDYYEHVKDNPNTLLSQFYGLHRVKMPYGKKIHFVVMNNLFPPHRDIHTIFDLKGSTVGRNYGEEDLENNPRATLKDLNWLRRQRSLELGIRKKRLFLEQLNKDVALLRKLQIMDYSLLVGIHDLQRGNEENLRDKTLQVFSPGGDANQDDSEPQSVLLRTPSTLENARKAKELRQMIRQERPVPMGQTASKMPDELDEQNRAGVFNQDDGGLRATHEDNSPAEEIYYLGVIDCLTHYGMVKKIEHFLKGLTSDRTQISALPPDEYGDRFYRFVEGITMSREEAERERQMKEQEAVEAAAAQKENERVSSWRSSSSRRVSNCIAIPPMPSHQPPPVPASSGTLSPQAQETMEKARRQANKSEERGANEDAVPEKTLKTVPAAVDRRESGQSQSILPVVEEAAEVHSTRRHRRDGDHHGQPPMTPARLGLRDQMAARSTPQHPPPTPPKNGLKPESQDSGYGTLAQSMEDSAHHEHFNAAPPRLSKDSLNKDLPPLPTGVELDNRGRGRFFS
ncbi:SAICAR synthase-like protein [Sodiomyces alkalinus F11]|uniref:1-phosphatidylinositol-4-phosphate 5-kinase n=1 Tax=Sodiomyces alkalinus (strain CBS 110278 / VKM F-3762 / F11) TaxID=1314773 RepID=A0A3N2PV53_SODAK|nr:SAICAR synthase-like protein [Sodiomyces alkalinus F11]ROT38370.1 SAICAR synthase-like protein [Sodiomyces alkalinus F11]